MSLVDQGLALPPKTDSEMDKSNQKVHNSTGPCSAVGSKSDCRSRGCEFDPGPVPYFCGD